MVKLTPERSSGVKNRLWIDAVLSPCTLVNCSAVGYLLSSEGHPMAMRRVPKALTTGPISCDASCGLGERFRFVG